ncbi:MAG: HD domain-containing protein [Dehalococcoidia bacterium]|nr:HD domain-containing protein [Dehalococcoidia bacterium]
MSTILSELQRFVVSKGVRAYLVGGFVRDALLGRASQDVDVCVDRNATDLAREFADVLGGAFVVLDAERDVARAVLERPGGHVHVDFARVRGGGIEADLALRDFTINAIAVPFPLAGQEPASWELVDPLHGRADLAASVIRVASSSSFRDDPVRPLRAIRFVAQLGFHLEDATRALLERDGSTVANASPERVRDEFLKALAQPRASQTLRLTDSVGILGVLIPELTAGKGVDQPPEHYWDVFLHNIECTARLEEILSERHRSGEDSLPFLRAIPWEPALDAHFAEEFADGHTRATYLKLIALLHDVAKPQTKAFTPDKRMRFFGHPEQGGAQAVDILRRLRCSERAVDHARVMIENHLRPNQMAAKHQLPTDKALYRYYRDVGDAAVDTVYLCLADYLAARGPWLTEPEWLEQCALMQHILAKGAGQTALTALPKLVDGNDLQQVFGLQPGPAFRSLLESVREAQAAGEVATREQALALVESLIAQNQRKDAKVS